MPDLQNVVTTVQDEPGNFALPVAIIEAKVQEGEQVLNDFTNANAIRFPSCLATLTPAQFEDFVNRNREWLIYTRAGMPTN